MDPNANLEEQRRLTQKLLSLTVGEADLPDLHSDAVRLAELVEALDVWLTRGGFLPSEWQALRP